MHVFYTPDIQLQAELPEEEAAHAIRVLRLQTGDEVMLTDGKGTSIAQKLVLQRISAVLSTYSKPFTKNHYGTGICTSQWLPPRTWIVRSGLRRKLLK